MRQHLEHLPSTVRRTSEPIKNIYLCGPRWGDVRHTHCGVSTKRAYRERTHVWRWRLGGTQYFRIPTNPHCGLSSTEHWEWSQAAQMQPPPTGSLLLEANIRDVGETYRNTRSAKRLEQYGRLPASDPRRTMGDCRMYTAAVTSTYTIGVMVILRLLIIIVMMMMMILHSNTTTYSTSHAARRRDGHEPLPHLFFQHLEEEEGKTILLMLHPLMIIIIITLILLRVIILIIVIQQRQNHHTTQRKMEKGNDQYYYYYYYVVLKITELHGKKL